MNCHQKKALDIVLEGHNLLILGTAGTGKSFLLGEIAKTLRLIGKRVQITCSTGIACSVYNHLNENACTVHKFTGISDGRHGPLHIVDVIKNNPKYDYVIDNINKIDTLIVDECSMISKEIFDSINNVCRIKKPDIVFGGTQIIFCGDFYQLQPVCNLSYGDRGEYCFESVDFNRVFPHRIILFENVRQREYKLSNAVNEVSTGRLSLDSETFIMSLNRPLLCHEIPSRTLKLFSRNDLADDYNRKCLLQSPGDMYEFTSSDKGKISDLCEITAPHVLWVKVGCPVILIRNLSNTLVNGFQGYLKDISDESAPVVAFPSVGIIAKIPKVKFTVFSPRLNTDIAVREQYPIKTAFGLTIHKAQGMTLSRFETKFSLFFERHF